MAPTSEDSRYAKSVISFMELCANIHPSLRKSIANSKVFHTFVLDLAQDGSVENVATFKEAHEKCAAAWKEVLEGIRAEKKRKATEEDGNPKKGARLCHGPDKDLPETLAANKWPTSTTSSLADEHGTSYTAEEVGSSSADDSDNSLFVPEEVVPIIQSAVPIITTSESKEQKSIADTESSHVSCGSKLSKIATLEVQSLAKIHKQRSCASPHSGVIETVAHMSKPLLALNETETISSAAMIPFTPSASHAVTESTADLQEGGVPHSGANRDVIVANTALISSQDMRDIKEVGITSGFPAVIAPIKTHCMTFSSHRYRESHIDDILSVCTRLNFDIVKHKLLGYLAGRPEPTSRPKAATTPLSTWEMHDPMEIVKALQIIGSNDQHSKVHRVFAQMRLYDMVKSKSESNGILTSQGSGKHVSGHLIVLENLAKRRAGDDSIAAQESMERRYTTSYFAGKRWSELAAWFDGVGIVLVFITSSIGNSYVESGWNEFQRDCLKYIADFLPSIKRLARRMGADVLDEYCRLGNLSEDLTGEIKRVKGYC